MIPAKCNVCTSVLSLPTFQGPWLLLSRKVRLEAFPAQSITCIHDHKVFNRNWFKDKKSQQTTLIFCRFYFFGGIPPKSFSAGSQSFPTEMHIICLHLHPGPEGRHANRVGASEQPPQWQESQKTPRSFWPLLLSVTLGPELVRNVDLGPTTALIKQNHHFNKILWGFIYTMKFEKHWF